MKCPNCTKEHTADEIEDACFLSTLLVVIRDRRGELSDAEIAHVLEHADADYLWESFGGPAADYVEDLVREAPSTTTTVP